MTPTDAYNWNVFALALCVWREARGEQFPAKLAVAYVVCTRAAKPRWWGETITSVIFHEAQFSSMTHTGDPNLVEWPKDADYSWTDSISAAKQAINKSVPNPTPDADSYYDTSIGAPPWATDAGFIGELGKLRFYRTV